MNVNWKHLVLGGGILAFARHIGFVIGFAAQVVWEGFLDGVQARKSINGDATSVVQVATGQATAGQKP